MTKQVLSIEQMQHLQELGLELKPSLIHYYKIINADSGKWYLSLTFGDISEDSPTYQYIPAYALQDVLDALPKEIKPNNTRYFLRIDLVDKCVYYYYDDHNFIEQRKKVIGYDGIDGLIDAAYKLLIWCIENNYVETNKNE